MSILTEREQAEIARADASGRPAIVLVHGLWLLAESWRDWRALLEDAGYATLAPGWPGDPETVEEARRRPEALAGLLLGQVTAHLAEVVGRLRTRPALIGHSFGGLVAQWLAGRGLAAATVAIDPAPFRGVLPLPLSALRAALPVLANPANRRRAVALTSEQFRYAFANAVSEDEARRLHAAHSVAGPAVLLFQAAAANLNPWTEVAVETLAPGRGPLLILSGERDHTVPRAMARAAWVRQRRNPGVTEFHEVAGRGHSLIIDGGWREVADLALAFLRRHHPAFGAGETIGGARSAHGGAPRP